jgi:hypothetical protein
MESEESHLTESFYRDTDLHSISGNTKRSSVVKPVFWNPNVSKISDGQQWSRRATPSQQEAQYKRSQTLLEVHLWEDVSAPRASINKQAQNERFTPSNNRRTRAIT